VFILKSLSAKTMIFYLGGYMMSIITFIGAGSTVFAKNVLGDCIFVPALNGFEFALH
jgi:hypothetical protein